MGSADMELGKDGSFGERESHSWGLSYQFLRACVKWFSLIYLCTVLFHFIIIIFLSLAHTQQFF